MIIAPKVLKKTSFGAAILNFFVLLQPQNYYEMVDNKHIIGRRYEKELLNKVLQSGKAELIAIYGRRRVGKTYLVKQFFNNTFDFAFTGTFETSKSVQLSLFQQEINRYAHTSTSAQKNWFDAFEQLRQYLSSLKKDQIIIFIDELPWMDTPKSNFLQAFAYFWNTWASTQPSIKLIVCGSATTWMLSNLIGDKGGLYGRVTQSIHLSPFNLKETEDFLLYKKINWSRYQITETYMILGGIPFYLDMLRQDLPFNQNIDNLFFKENAPLKTEYDFLFRSLFKESTIYRKIVETLSTRRKGLTLSQIKEALKLTDGGYLTKIMDNLTSCDFIRRYSAFGKRGKDTLYQLTDLFSLFHLQYVEKNNGQDEHFWNNMQDNPSRYAWSGYAFEQVCLHHIQQIKNALGISGILSKVCSWTCESQIDKDGNQWNGTQIDLIIERRDNVINLCEMKFSKEEYTISKEYDQHLRERQSTFQHLTRTKNAIHLTFVTTFGLKQNLYSGNIQQVVTLNHLFSENL